MHELKITHLDDVEWQEVKAQQHGDRRVSVWEKYLEWTPQLMVLYARYDPGMLIERHGHKRSRAGAAPAAGGAVSYD